MKNRVLFIISVLLTLVAASCSSYVTDLGKLTKGTKYTVNHLLQNVDAVDDEDYTFDFAEELYGKPGELTAAVAKKIKGFSLKKDFVIPEVEIAEDGSTVIEIKYDRNEYTFQFDPDGGLWNYDQAKENPSVPKLSDTVKVTGRYGAIVKANDDYPDFSKLKKKGCIFIGWKKNGSDKVLTTEELESKLPETFVVQEEDVVYVAQWEINGTKYIVRHMTEDLDGNYSLSKEVELAGDVDDMTEAVPIDIEGFIKPEESSVVQKVITDNADNPTVVEIKYKRASYNVNIDLNGGYWNYYSHKNNSGITLNGDVKSISVKFGAEFRLADNINSDIGKQSMKNNGWFKDGDTTVAIPTDNVVIPEMPARDVSLKALWSENKVDYTLECWFENAGDEATVVWPQYTKVKEGLAETQTNITLEDLQSVTGFEKPEAISNAEIKADGSTVIKVEYKRIRRTLTLKTDGGLWNYAANKADSSVRADDSDKFIPVKYGAVINYPAELNALGKKGSALKCWRLDGTSKTVTSLPESFENTEDVSYIAEWDVKTTKYKVEYHLQNIDGTEYVLSDKDTVELSGVAETPTKVSLTPVDGYYVIKDIPGFTKPEKVDNAEINPDGTTVIVLKYTRNSYEITFNLDDGLWNYSVYNADPSNVVADNKSRTINVKYEDIISYPPFTDVNKRSYELLGWTTDSGNTVSTGSLPVTQTVTKNVTYTASWRKLSNVAYKVEHYFENVDSDNDTLEANYSIDSKYNENKSGIAEMLTEAAAKTVTGFTAKEIEQLEINRDGSTVVKVYYKRNIVNINLDLNGGYWDYNKDSRTGNDNVIKTVSGKYGTNVNYESVSFTGIGRRSYDFKGWVKTGTATPVSSNSLITIFPEADVTYTASWENIGNVAYKVEHWFEKLNATSTTQNSTYYEQKIDDYPTETLYGVEGDSTDATAKTVEGFTAANISQVSIARNGSTVVKIYYTRNTSKIILKVNGGKWSGGTTADKTYTGKFGKTLTDTIPEPTRSGWAFGGWNEYNGTVDKIYGAEDVTYSAYWIPSVTVTPTFNGDISMTVNTVSGTTTGTVTLPDGYVASDCNYRWYVDGVFASDDAALSKKLNNGIHTISVKVIIDGISYTKQATVTIHK